MELRQSQRSGKPIHGNFLRIFLNRCAGWDGCRVCESMDALPPDLNVWHLSWVDINHVVYIVGVYACHCWLYSQTKTGKKPDLTYFGEKNQMKTTVPKKMFFLHFLLRAIINFKLRIAFMFFKHDCALLLSRMSLLMFGHVFIRMNRVASKTRHIKFVVIENLSQSTTDSLNLLSKVFSTCLGWRWDDKSL